jgi:eukaryotic-like serine/threonine-protein kinase
MPLAVGTRLGPYEILAPIGAGGMGQVWKARDSRLDRIVAIKVSNQQFSERSGREARAVAALNHPHVCQLYDVGPDYLVMEFIEGASLKGPLPLEKAVEYARQILDALDAAHKKGITHRDLKPTNILVTKAGIKILDFGLAKFAQTKEALANNETATQTLTQTGAIVGTLRYMAPEQLQGKVVDTRADIFSFGCVLYEMLTGKRAFEGANATSLIAGILERPAPSVAEVAPPALDWALQRCLAKDPEERWQTARDLQAELVRISAGGPDVPRQVADGPASGRRMFVYGAASLLLAALAALAGWMLKPAPAPARPVSRVAITLGPTEHLANLNTPAVAVSPDGANIVYVASRGGGPAQLFLRPLDTLKAAPMAGTEGANSPFFSPDGQWIAFFAEGKLKKVAIAGGAPITLCDAGSEAAAPGGTWGPNNTIVLQELTGPFLEVPAGGGTPRRLTAGAKHPYSRWAEFAPDGAAIVFAGGSNTFAFPATAAIVAAPINGAAEEKSLIAAGTSPRLTAMGDLVYAQNGNLMAVPFNSKRLELAGSPAPVLAGVRESTYGAAQYSLSATGTLVYVPGGMQGSLSRLVWVDRTGKEQALAAPAHGYNYPRLSPDGRRIATIIQEATADIWLLDMGREALYRATFGGTNTSPVWSPDGRRFAFQSDRSGGPPNLYWQRADGSGEAERLTTSTFVNSANSFSPDARHSRMSNQPLRPSTISGRWVLGTGRRDHS